MKSTLSALAAALGLALTAWSAQAAAPEAYRTTLASADYSTGGASRFFGDSAGALKKAATSTGSAAVATLISMGRQAGGVGAGSSLGGEPGLVAVHATPASAGVSLASAGVAMGTADGAAGERKAGLGESDSQSSASGTGIPEPGNWAIIVAGLLGVCAIARRRMSI